MKEIGNCDELHTKLIQETFPQLEVFCIKDGVFYVNIKDTKVCLLFDKKENPNWKTFRQSIIRGVNDAARNFQNVQKIDLEADLV